MGSNSLSVLENLRLRLLDITSRNKLLNFTHTKSSSLRIVDELPDQLYEVLVSEQELRLLSVPEPSSEEVRNASFSGNTGLLQETEEDLEKPPAEEWAAKLGIEVAYEVPDHSVNAHTHKKHNDHGVQTLLYPLEMEQRLKNLYLKARTAIEESGANVLYLNFGFLEWTEYGESDNPQFAPLFLVPVRINKGRLNKETKIYEYTLSYSGEDILPNLSLREKLRIDFGLALPDMDDKVTPEEYFQSVAELIGSAASRWKIKRYITLALLNFSKLLMYLDLDPKRWPDSNKINEHPIVQKFLEGIAPDSQVTSSTNQEYCIDDLEGIHDRYPLIKDADSSQHSALIDALDGKNLVIEGPPGTGKSQTITNIIAAAIANGKKVLFVAEKLAALEIVKRHLDSVGLGEFCLELHSHKTQKRKFLDDVSSRLKSRGTYRKPVDINAEITRFEELKRELKQHTEQINSFWKNTGKTIHELLVGATRYRRELDINLSDLHPTSYTGDLLTPHIMKQLEDDAEIFSVQYQAVVQQVKLDEPLTKHPWYGVTNTGLQVYDEERVYSSLKAWNDSLLQLVAFREELLQDGPGYPDELTKIDQFESLLTELQHLKVPGEEVLVSVVPRLKAQEIADTREFLDLTQKIQSEFEALSDANGTNIKEQFANIDRYQTGCDLINKLVHEDVLISSVKASSKELSLLIEEIEGLTKLVERLSASLGQDGLFQVHQSGIAELRRFIQLVSALDPSLWAYRNEVFFQDDLDSLLLELENEQESILNLKNEIVDKYDIESLPDESQLRVLRSALANTGMFSWLSSEWRHAKKALLALRVNSKINFKSLLGRLNTTIEYVRKKHLLDNNERYQQFLTGSFQGMETDVEILRVLRNWHQDVQEAYTSDLEADGRLMDVIIHMPLTSVKVIHSLFDRGINRKLDDILKCVEHLGKTFGKVSSFTQKDAVLVGVDGYLADLYKSVVNALALCNDILTDRESNVGALRSYIDRLCILAKDIKQWKESDVDTRVFNGQLTFQIASDVDNTEIILVANATLEFATIINEKLQSGLLVEKIHRNPSRDTVSSLIEHRSILEKVLLKNNKAFEAFSTLCDLDDEWVSYGEDGISSLVSRNQLAIKSIKTLHNWIDYKRSSDHMIEIGLGKVVDASQIEKYPIRSLVRASLYDLLSREILKEFPAMAYFSGRTQETLQRQFSKYDERLAQLQAEKIAWLADQAEVPIGKTNGNVTELTEKSLLSHESNKKTRHLPIRQLIKRSANALVALKPCFMMGPLSAAQYLAPGKFQFDMVIMDEASQIKPEDALGVMARGAQAIIVGDPRQLPPTSFFEKLVAGEDEDDLTAIEESESILNATLPIFPTRRLQWHYRSRHEDLIAFSNHSFYQGDLVLFPSPHNESGEFGIQYTRVKEGCFVNRINHAEASAISRSVMAIMLQHPGESVGVVAMNAQQRDIIEDAIEGLSKENDEFRNLLQSDDSREEPLFIKNLENVQGDERDIIFVSMTYGPASLGEMVAQRFGPINSDLGWRRLNVLLTRARKSMHIFSSMGFEDIHVNERTREGVKALRNFLQFAEGGALYADDEVTSYAKPSDFQVAMAEVLEKDGFECEFNVGVAGIFVEVAVRDPENRDRFILGIESDGEYYQSGNSVRERDRLREAVLEGLGWTLHRVWSVDWYKNPEAELQYIREKLKDSGGRLVHDRL